MDNARTDATATTYRLSRPGLAVALVFALAGVGCASNPAGGGPDFVLMSEKKELLLGAQHNTEILDQYGRYNDERLQKYLDDLGQKLAALSERPHLEWHFTILDTDEVNAFALPGGYIYITRGMMAYINSEAELAAVIGHEIGHVTARHAVRQHGKTQLVNVLGGVAGYATGVGGIGRLFGGALLSGYSRGYELEADALGARYVAKADYPVDSMLDVIEILKRREVFEIERAKKEFREPRVYHGFFATHPDNDTRYREVINEAKGLGEGDPEMVRQQEYMERIDGMLWGPGQQTGVLRGNKFYHGTLGIKLSFPEGWRVDSKGGGLVAVSGKSDATLTISGVPYDEKRKPRDMLATRLGLTGLRDGKEITVNGLPAYIGISSYADSPYGKRPVRYALVMDHRRKRSLLFAGSGKYDKNAIAADKDFIKTIFSLDDMEPEEAKLAVPSRVRVVRAGGKTTMQTLADESAITNYAEEELRLMNDLYPGGEPVYGQLLKTVE